MNLSTFLPFGGRSRTRAVSLYDELPHADTMPRSLPRVELVAADDVVGTTRKPSTLTDDFLPPPAQRTAHWRHDFGRILDSLDNLSVLPPVDLLKVCGRYYVVDGHKRVAAARRVRGTLDAIVVELHVPRCTGAAPPATRCA
jgi:hypothetical protein